MECVAGSPGDSSDLRGLAGAPAGGRTGAVRPASAGASPRAPARTLPAPGHSTAYTREHVHGSDVRPGDVAGVTQASW